MAAVLREIGADVVALQEVADLGGERLAAPLAALCDEAGYALVEGPTLVRGTSPFGNALLSRLPVEGIERADLTVAAWEPRGALAATLRHPEGSSCQVVNTHLGLRARERRRQVALLLDWIDARLPHVRPDLLVVAGDFNEWWPRAAALRRLRAVFGASASARTFPAGRPWLRLDRIWVQPASSVRGRITAHDTPLARAASDHLPIVAELEPPRRGEGLAALRPPGGSPAPSVRRRRRRTRDAA